MSKLRSTNFLFKRTNGALVIALAFVSFAAHGDNDGFFTDGVTSNKERAADARSTESKASKARVGGAPKTPAVKTITNFTQALRCMDELFLANNKQGIVITSAGIPDSTGKARAGDKEMMISAISKMTMKSNAFEFIDLTQGSAGEGDLAKLFELKGGGATKIPDFYIRGAVTQLDDNAVRESKGVGIALPFLDLGFSKDQSFDLISMDMSVGDASTRRILPETNTSNTMIITKGGRSGEAGGKIEKLGLSFNKDLSRTEGVGATYRTLIELGLIEALGKFTRVPYWKCLEIDSTNPDLLDQVREWYDVATDKERLTFIQQKLAGMSRYKGPLDGQMSDELKNAISEYQAYVGLIADGRVNFDLYFSLKDDIQNQLAALPITPKRPIAAGAAAAPVQSAPVATSAIPFQINLTSDRGTTPSYKVGEYLNMKLSLNKLGFAYCFYEDIEKNTARVLPNRFYPNSMLSGNTVVQLPSGGFKIKFDRPGRERVACIASDRELVVPSGISNSKDLSPLTLRSVEQVISQFKNSNPIMTSSIVDISVQ
jgi:peptidoglycan hydrolase-like protein with peptidoglycan-binding domain